MTDQETTDAVLRPTSIPRALTLDDMVAVARDERVTEGRQLYPDAFACGVLTGLANDLLTGPRVPRHLVLFAQAAVIQLPADEYAALLAEADRRAA